MNPRPILACLIVLAACSASPAPTTTKVLREPAEPTTTEASTTTVAETTAALPEVVSLGLRAEGSLPLRPDVTYLHDFVTPVGFTFEQPGWSVDLVGDRTVGFLNDEGERSLAVYVTFMPHDSVEELLAFVQEHEKSIEVTDPLMTTPAGFDAVTVDVLVPPGRTPGSGERECWSSYAGPVWYAQKVYGAGYPSVLVGCAWNRVWIVEVDGVSVVIHAGDVGGEPDGEPVTLDGVEGLIDEFLSALTFDDPVG